jgi:predicted aminopeptidase
MPVPSALRRLPLLAAALVLAASACSPAYVLRASWEEAKILHRRKPIARIIADPRTPAERRAKLQLVLDARAFARDSLGLKVGKSYTLFSEVRSDTLALVLSAARKDRFVGYSWWFPIVGRVPYKGFFREADALREMRRLEARGYDTYLRPTTAFSTLGWFTDPLLSTLLRYDSVELGNTVIHEVTHNTLYVGGQAMFNESLANFVGGRGAIRFFCGREGPDSKNCRQATDEWQDDLLFGAFMSEMVGRLEALYGRADLTAAQKVEQREALFDQAKADFKNRIQPRFRAGTYSSFLTAPLNNATLISRRLYYGHLELFESLYQARGGDLARTVADIVAAARGSKDPYAAVERLLPPGQGL